MGIIKSVHAAIHHDAKSATATIALTDKITDKAAIQNELLKLTTTAIHNKAKSVLIDNTKLNHPIGRELQEWALVNVELQLLTHGVDKIAIMVPKNSQSFAMVSKSDTHRKRYFDDIKAAKAWLNS